MSIEWYDFNEIKPPENTNVIVKVTKERQSHEIFFSSFRRPVTFDPEVYRDDYWEYFDRHEGFWNAVNKYDKFYWVEMK